MRSGRRRALFMDRPPPRQRSVARTTGCGQPGRRPTGTHAAIMPPTASGSVCRPGRHRAASAPQRDPHEPTTAPGAASCPEPAASHRGRRGTSPGRGSPGHVPDPLSYDMPGRTGAHAGQHRTGTRRQIWDDLPSRCPGTRRPGRRVMPTTVPLGTPTVRSAALPSRRIPPMRDIVLAPGDGPASRTHSRRRERVLRIGGA